ncbi:hypothetical protein [Collimonas sp.]|jgi:hypothetical protein|uniref:hypothetical protein n=1 Tax=Collimonas sp. TaxID=1963772 RepID=UPI002C094102|nr:hypothetical protein [Collimonas sp.]HWW05297.1 hypothetical protein [Collimonas sp.]
MNQFVAGSAVRFAGASSIQSSQAAASNAAPPASENPAPKRIDGVANVANRAVLLQRDIAPSEPPPVSLPLLGSRTGNLFADRVDPTLHWYLASFLLHQDIDPGFAFRASQSGQDESGNPFYTAQLCLTLQKSQPGEVGDFSKANPAATLREIPLAEMTAMLSSFYTDEAGQTKQRDIIGTVRDNGDGNLLLTFTPIMGVSVLGLYQDLTVFGKTQIKLSASYQAWAPQDQLTFVRPQLALLSATAQPPVSVVPVMRMRLFTPVALQATRLADPQPSVPLVQTREVCENLLPLALKYRQDGYQLKYTVSTDQIPNRVIRDANDLRDFAHGGSEFSELKALGDIGLKYPTLSRAYVGSFSRTIVVIPDHYSIVRSRIGCAAVCMALVDSAASNGSQCKFEFDFTVAPEVSRIEFLQFAQEISRNPDLKDYKLKFPDFLQDNLPSNLQTVFKSRAQFLAGSDPHTFVVSVSIQDDGTQTPSVANANLFIMQLCANIGAGLIGSLNLKLDDGYSIPVPSTLVLNFAHTTGTDELDVQIDEASAQIRLSNQSPLDLQVARYALVSAAAITLAASPLHMPAGAAVSIPLPAEHADLSFAADAQLILPTPMTKADITKFLNFQTADVQETQYVIAIDAGSVNFNKLDSIVASITFATLPAVVPQVLTLTKHIHADSTHIVIPLENAVFSLPGEVNLTIKFSDGATADLKFTLQNDFTAQPVLLLLQSDIDKNMASQV